MPASVATLLGQHDRLARLFAGKAEGVGADGCELGSPESYDLTLATKLALKGVTDPDDLAIALKRRPDGNAASQGDAYVAGIIAKALSVAAPVGSSAAGSGGHPFVVTDVEVFDCDPPRFTLAIKLADDESVPITFNATQLIDPRQFLARCFEKLRKFLALPPEWRESVEGWMTSARLVTPPPEGTRVGATELAVRRALGRITPCESFDDLRDGRGVVAEQRHKKVILFEIDAVMMLLRSSNLKPSHEEVAQALLAIGAKHGRRTVTLAGRSRKTPACWCFVAPKELVDSMQPSVATSSAGGKVLPFPAPPSGTQPDVSSDSPDPKDANGDDDDDETGIRA